jgi:hypothetical protein
MATFQQSNNETNKDNYNYENHSHDSIISDKADLSQCSHNYCKRQHLTAIAEAMPNYGYKVTKTEKGFIIGLPQAPQRLATIDFETSTLEFNHPKLKELLDTATANCEWFEDLEGKQSQGFMPELVVLCVAPLHQLASGGRFF